MAWSGPKYNAPTPSTTAHQSEGPTAFVYIRHPYPPLSTSLLFGLPATYINVPSGEYLFTWGPFFFSLI